MPKTIIDDTDHRATYSDRGWDQRGSEFEFGATTHGAHFKGAHVTVRFIGHSVAVFGTIAEAGFFSKPSTSTYSVDGSSPVLYTAVLGKHAQYKQQFFHVANLSEGEHTLVVTSTSSAPFWLDYFEVETQDDPGSIPATQLPTLLTQTPTPSLSLSSSEDLPTASTDVAFPNPTSTPFITSAPSPQVPPGSQNKPIIIDDTDARVKYSGYWFVAGVLEGNQATSHGTQNNGAMASLTFTGTAISVIGTIAEAQGVSNRVSTYSIDGIDPTTFTSPQLNSALYKHRLFQSPELPDGQHTLVVTAGAGDAPFWLDYFEVYNASSLSTRTYIYGSTSIGPPSSGPSDPSTNHPVQSTSTGSSSHVGAIAGGVIGGLAALCLIIAYIIFRRRRKSPAAYIPTAPDPDWTPGPTWTNEKLTLRHHMERV